MSNILFFSPEAEAMHAGAVDYETAQEFKQLAAQELAADIPQCMAGMADVIGRCRGIIDESDEIGI